MLTIDLAGEHTDTVLPVAAVYRQLAPVPAPLCGTTLPSAAIEHAVAEGTTNVHNTDMGAAVLIERVSDGTDFGATGWQLPSVGFKKRHGATRGRPPREHLRGLLEARSDLSRPRLPPQGSRPFFMASARSRSP
ncbi:hypothetical protein GCM10028833_19600 [Glycomyces tarimensis]